MEPKPQELDWKARGLSAPERAARFAADVMHVSRMGGIVDEEFLAKQVAALLFTVQAEATTFTLRAVKGYTPNEG